MVLITYIAILKLRNKFEIIDEHIIIRETIGYEALNDIPVADIPQVLSFLKIVFNYKKWEKKLDY